MINGNAVGGTAPIKTVKIVDENGLEILGVVTESEVIFTATDNDVREGYVYAGDGGVSTGTKVIPSYHTSTGVKKIASGKTFVIRDENYDYDFVQAIICSYNTSSSNSVAATMVVIDDNVYEVNSIESIAIVEKDHENQQINLNITNNTDSPQIIRYTFIKEML